MKYKATLIILIMYGVWFACSTAMAQSDAGSRGIERQSSSQVFDARENYAVIVGVDSYDLATPLSYAVADAKKLAAFFESQGYLVDLLLNNTATPTRILRRLKTVGKVATNGGTKQQGNLVFAFSGHGFQKKGENGQRDENYLATGETDPDDLQGTALSLTEVQRTLRETGVKQRVLFIDACRNDPSKGNGYANGTFVPDTNAEGEAILYSTRSGTLSWEDNTLGHGVFTHYLVQGLEGAATGRDGLVSFNDLQHYVVGEVKRHVWRRFNKSQIPYIGGERTGEFVVAKYGNRPPDPEPKIDYASLEQKLRLSKEERRRVQQALNAEGQSVGAPDGVFGLKTRMAIRNWRESNGFETSDFLDSRSYKVLVAALPATPLPPQRKSFEPEMIRIEGGVFEMGSTEGNEREKPVHTVRVSSFEMGKTEVTLGQWRSFVEDSQYVSEAHRDVDGKGCVVWNAADEKWVWAAGYHWDNVGFEQAEDHPVVCVSWNDVIEYVKWLNKQTDGGDYRLPSEAEWEYAARSGGKGQYHFGDSEKQLCAYGNGADKSTEEEFSWSNKSCTDGFERTAPVGSYQANGNGLYDVHGNVWEWVADCWHDSYKRAPEDGLAWMESNDGDCGRRVLRGGSWSNGPGNLRSANRSRDDLSGRDGSTGFRLSRTLTP